VCTQASVAHDSVSEDHEAAAIDDRERPGRVRGTAAEGDPAFDTPLAPGAATGCFQSKELAWARRLVRCHAAALREGSLTLGAPGDLGFGTWPLPSGTRTPASPGRRLSPRGDLASLQGYSALTLVFDPGK
jgi:hypothetical protein